MSDMRFAKRLVVSFLEEACRFLQMDADTISVSYSQRQSPFGVFVWGADDEITVEVGFLEFCALHNAFTKLRERTYFAARLIQQRRLHGVAYSLQSEQAMDDAMGFANAMMFMKGIQCPCPPIFSSESYFARSLAILRDEFGLRGSVFEMQKRCLPNPSGQRDWKSPVCQVHVA